jgi:hypothetical protein
MEAASTCRQERGQELTDLAIKGPWSDIAKAAHWLGPDDRQRLLRRLSIPITSVTDQDIFRELFTTWPENMAYRLCLLDDEDVMQEYANRMQTALSAGALQSIATTHPTWVMAQPGWCTRTVLGTVILNTNLTTIVTYCPTPMPLECVAFLLLRATTASDVAAVLAKAPRRFDSKLASLCDDLSVDKTIQLMLHYLSLGGNGVLRTYPNVVFPAKEPTLLSLLKQGGPIAVAILDHQIMAGQPLLFVHGWLMYIIDANLPDRLSVYSICQLTPDMRNDYAIRCGGAMWCPGDLGVEPSLEDRMLHAAVWGNPAPSYQISELWGETSKTRRAEAFRSFFDRMDNEYAVMAAFSNGDVGDVGISHSKDRIGLCIDEHVRSNNRRRRYHYHHNYFLDPTMYTTLDAQGVLDVLRCHPRRIYQLTHLTLYDAYSDLVVDSAFEMPSKNADQLVCEFLAEQFSPRGLIDTALVAATADYLRRVAQSEELDWTDTHSTLEDHVFSWLSWAVSRVNDKNHKGMMSWLRTAYDTATGNLVDATEMVVGVVSRLRRTTPTHWVAVALAQLQGYDVASWVHQVDHDRARWLPFISAHLFRRFITTGGDVAELDTWADRFVPECHAHNLLDVTWLPPTIRQKLLHAARNTCNGMHLHYVVARLAVQTSDVELMCAVMPQTLARAMRYHVMDEKEIIVHVMNILRFTAQTDQANFISRMAATRAFIVLLKSLHPVVRSDLLHVVTLELDQVKLEKLLNRLVMADIPYCPEDDDDLTLCYADACMHQGRLEHMPPLERLVELIPQITTMDSLPPTKVPEVVLEACHRAYAARPALWLPFLTRCVADNTTPNMSDKLCDLVGSTTDGIVALAHNTTTPYARVCVLQWVKATLAVGDYQSLFRLRGCPLASDVYVLVAETESLYLALSLLNDETNTEAINAIIVAYDQLPAEKKSYVGLMLLANVYGPAFATIPPFGLSADMQRWLAATSGHNITETPDLAEFAWVSRVAAPKL